MGNNNSISSEKSSFDIKDKKKILAHLSQVDLKSSKKIFENLETESTDVDYYILFCSGYNEATTCWRTKNITVYSIILPNVPIQLFNFLKHNIYEKKYISIHLDPSTFNFMSFFMDSVMYFISRNEFIEKIIKICKEYDDTLFKYFSTPFKQPNIEKPIFSTSFPENYYKQNKINNYTQNIEEEILLSDEIKINSDESELSDDENNSLRSYQSSNKIIPELQELDFSDYESSFMSPISEYSNDEKNKDEIQESSFIERISESDVNSIPSTGFIGKYNYKYHSNIESESEIISIPNSSEIPISSKPIKKHKTKERKVNKIPNDDFDSRSASFLSSELELSEVSNISNKKENINESKKIIPKKVYNDIEIDKLNLSDDDLPQPPILDEDLDSIILDETPIKIKKNINNIKSRSIEINPIESSKDNSIEKSFEEEKLIYHPIENKKRQIPILLPDNDLILTDSSDDEKVIIKPSNNNQIPPIIKKDKIFLSDSDEEFLFKNKKNKEIINTNNSALTLSKNDSKRTRTRKKINLE